MKKKALLLLMSLVFFIATDAPAQEWCGEEPRCDEDCGVGEETHFYAKVFGGANCLQNSAIDENTFTYQTGHVVAGSLGYCWHYGLRLEAEYAYRRNSIKKIKFFVEGASKHGHYAASSYMANVLWNVPLASLGCPFWNIEPFIGAGIGYASQKMYSYNSRVVFNQKFNRFSWQLMAGLAYSIFCNTEMTLGYAFHQGGCHFNNNSIRAGLLYKFGL